MLISRWAIKAAAVATQLNRSDSPVERSQRKIPNIYERGTIYQTIYQKCLLQIKWITWSALRRVTLPDAMPCRRSIGAPHPDPIPACWRRRRRASSIAASRRRKACECSDIIAASSTRSNKTRHEQNLYSSYIVYIFRLRYIYWTTKNEKISKNTNEINLELSW